MSNQHLRHSINGAQPEHPGRRRFVRGIAATAVVASASGFGGVLPAFAQHRASTRFSRMFPQLPAFAEPSTGLTAALLDIGKPEGIMDAHDDLAAGPVALIVDPSPEPRQSRTQRFPDGHAGTTFMGQFMDHDMTFDTRSRLGVTRQSRRKLTEQPDAGPSTSTRCTGADRSPMSSSTTRPTGSSSRSKGAGVFEDLPRAGHRARDHRRSAQRREPDYVRLHAAFLLFHNHAVDACGHPGCRSRRKVFDEAPTDS